MQNKPLGRRKNVTGTGKPIYKRGEGLHSGPVGSSDGYQGKRPTSSSTSQSPVTQRPNDISFGQNDYSGQTGSSAQVTRGSGKGSILIIAIVAIVALLGGGGLGLGSLFGGGSEEPAQPAYSSTSPSNNNSSSQTFGGFDLGSLFGGSVGGVSTGWEEEANTEALDQTVDPSARAKRTVIRGGGKDTVTVMVYMCGTDLESQNGMGSSDLREMAAANLADNVNVIIYTGGAKKWKINSISSSVNQIYKIDKTADNHLRCLVKNDGSKAMTDPNTLAGFIQYCNQNFPANRNELILWDHGGGSITGYGYDEKNVSSGSMTLSKLDQALKKGGVTFDFIGFDACLMATLENALTLTPYGDYLIASEETEPGIGWYYTDWLNKLSKNTSMPTIEIGKNIVDGFVDKCNTQCRGQKTTLSVIDLAEIENTVPEKFSDFASNLSDLIGGDEFKTVSNARSGSREFGSSSKVDQVDLVNLAQNIGTKESRALADTLLKAVKYNRTCSSITNAYGLSIYFPYQRTSQVNNAVAAYNAIGLDSEYARCIQQFASLEVGGQTVSGGSFNPLSMLQGASSGGSMLGSDMIGSLLGNLFSGSSSGGLGFFGRSLDMDAATAYLSDEANRFDPGALVWKNENGEARMRLSDQQWELVQKLELNVFFDDGEGYIDLGLDNIFDFTDDGALKGEFDGTWLAINDQPVAYYHMDTVQDGDNYTITGRVPVMLNGKRADLIIVFDNENPYGYIAGARTDYRGGETETVAKSTTGLEKGDVIEFLCDYYSYDGDYLDSYYLGEAMTYDGDFTISNVYIDEQAASATYLFTDIYCQKYWTPVIP